DVLFGSEFIVTAAGAKVGNNVVEDGNDVLQGGAGDDVLYGGRGNDQLRGDAGLDRIDGQSGEDPIQFPVALNDAAMDVLTGGPQRDIIEILGTAGADSLTVQQLQASTFQVDRRDPTTGAVTATFKFSLPADPAARDIEVLRVSGLGGNDTIRDVGTFNV